MSHNKVTPYNSAESKKQQVEEMFDNIAGRYDLLNHTLSLGIDHFWRWRAINYLKAGKPKHVLDMATGTGDFAMAALRLKPEQVVGIDIAEKMLDVGKVKAKRKGVSEKVVFLKGDSEHILAQDNSFDAITVGFGVRNFENLDKGLSELNRVLEPGGRMVILEISQPRMFPMRQIFQLYFTVILPAIGLLVSKDPRAYTYLPESVAAFPEGPDFVKRLEQAGFRNVKWKPLTFGICAMYTSEK